MAVDSGFIVAVAFVDFRKAFDSVSHRVLLEKLCTNLSICDQALGWIASYLNGRKQYTVVNGQNCIRRYNTEISAWPPCTVLFVCQRSTVKSGSVYLLADDLTIYCIKKTADEAVSQWLKL